MLKSTELYVQKKEKKEILFETWKTIEDMKIVVRLFIFLSLLLFQNLTCSMWVCISIWCICLLRTINMKLSVVNTDKQLYPNVGINIEAIGDSSGSKCLSSEHCESSAFLKPSDFYWSSFFLALFSQLFFHGESQQLLYFQRKIPSKSFNFLLLSFSWLLIAE